MGGSVGVVGLGYEGLSIEEFAAQVVARDIDIVVDVRLNALSRKRGFSKNGLRAAVAEFGVEYLHLPVLGNPKDNRDGFSVPGSRAGDRARGAYRDLLDAQGASEDIADVARRATVTLVGVMCFEANQHECHRELVIERVEQTLRELLQPAVL